LNAARLAVRFGICSGGSQGRTFVRRMGSSVGGLSTMYEIHACQPGSICELSPRIYQHLSSWKNCRRGSIRVELLVLIVYPSCPHCSFVSMWTVIESLIASLHGSSSARFSKYLLPYRSVAIKVPALVSPMPFISQSAAGKLYSYFVPIYCKERTMDQLCCHCVLALVDIRHTCI
jgi:hypothetical protein